MNFHHTTFVVDMKLCLKRQYIASTTTVATTDSGLRNCPVAINSRRIEIENRWLMDVGCVCTGVRLGSITTAEDATGLLWDGWSLQWIYAY